MNAPNYRLVSTNLEGQKRFISSIARRLNQLGALTRGQREAATNGLFDATDNLEDDYAKAGLKKLYEDIVAGKVEGISLKAFADQTGLRLVDDTTGQLRDDLPPITRFLNRLLSLTCAMQNRMFTEFSNRHREAIEHAINAGTFDTGVETKRAESVKLIRELEVYRDESSDARSTFVELEVRERLHPRSFDDLKDKAEFWAINTQSGFVWAGSRTHNRTDARTGDVFEQFRLSGPLNNTYIDVQDFHAWNSHWDKIDPDQARTLWEKRLAETPTHKTHRAYMIAGLVLPIFDKIKGGGNMVRLATDDGKRYLGKEIPEADVPETLKALGLTNDESAKVTVEQAVRVLRERTHHVSLESDRHPWVLRCVTVEHQPRVELVGPGFYDGEWLKAAGVPVEYDRSNRKSRCFVPLDNSAALEAIFSRHEPGSLSLTTIAPRNSK